MGSSSSRKRGDALADFLRFVGVRGDDAPVGVETYSQRAVLAYIGLRIFQVPIREAFGKVGENARGIALGLPHHCFQFTAHVRAKPVFIAMLALAVAGPRHDVVNGFHAGGVLDALRDDSGLCLDPG